jgi:hypothetical protein
MRRLIGQIGIDMRDCVRRLLVLIGCLLAGGMAHAAEPATDAERYAYLFLQGKVSGAGRGGSEAGATVLLTSRGRTFEARTDDRGVFAFEKLPLASYELRIVTADGKVMRSIRAFDDPRGIRLEARTGRGEGKKLRLDATPHGGRVTYEVPEHAPDWKRFWMEFGLIVGAAGIFAL